MGVLYEVQGRLCNHRIPWRFRIKFFDKAVSPTFLYGCEAWTLTVQDDHDIKTTRRRMLRWMWGARRRANEDWIDFCQRVTHESEEEARLCGAQDWVLACYKRKWDFAGKVARCKEGQWRTRLLNWTPWYRTMTFRLVGRPRLRWDHCFQKVAGGNWTECAQDVETWDALMNIYVYERQT